MGLTHFAKRSRPRGLLAGLFILAIGIGFIAARHLYAASLIKPLLPGPGTFSCFTGTYAAHSVDIEDWTKGKQVPSGKLRPDGTPHMWTVFDRETNVPVERVTLRLDHDTRKSDYDWIFNFTLVAQTSGKGMLHARGECPWYDKDVVETPIGLKLPAGAFTLACGIDCDGGLMDLTRMTGRGALSLAFGRRIGLTMKPGCGGGGRFRVYANASEQEFRLDPAPQSACAQLNDLQ